MLELITERVEANHVTLLMPAWDADSIFQATGSVARIEPE